MDLSSKFFIFEMWDEQGILKPIFFSIHLGIVYLVRTQNFSKNWHFLPPDTHTYVYISAGKK